MLTLIYNDIQHVHVCMHVHVHVLPTKLIYTTYKCVSTTYGTAHASYIHDLQHMILSLSLSNSPVTFWWYELVQSLQGPLRSILLNKSND